MGNIQINKLQRILKITITNNLTIKCVLFDKHNNQTPIILHDNKEEYPLSISFERNKIKVCEDETHQTVKFIETFFNKPNYYTFYITTFQDKEYDLLVEILFALIFEKFKQHIPDDVIISQTIIEIENQLDPKIYERIQIALKLMGMNNINFNEKLVKYDYYQQGKILHELLEKQSMKEQYERLFEKAIERITNEQEKELLQQSKENVYDEITFQKEMRKYSMEHRLQLKLCQLNEKCLFLSSQWFETIDDHINFVNVSKRLKKNMEKYQHNPLSLNETTVKYFPNIDTLHIYERNDKYLVSGRITKYVDWITRNWNEVNHIKLSNKTKDIYFKDCIWSTEDSKEEETKGNIYIEIPKEVKRIEENAFYQYGRNLKRITIPETIEQIPERCFRNCLQLTNISLPMNETRVVYGNRILNNQPHLDLSLIIPESIKIINGEEVHQIVTLPTFITSLSEKCLNIWKYAVKEITFPSNMNDQFDYSVLNQMTGLTKISLPMNETRVVYGNKIFNNQEHFNVSIDLPSTIKMINRELVDTSSLSIPLFVTSIDKNCFNTYYTLRELTLSNISEEFDWEWMSKCRNITKLCLPELLTPIPHNVFLQLIFLKELVTLSDDVVYGDRFFITINGCLQSILLPSTLRKINGELVQWSQINSFTLPSDVTKLADYCFVGCKQLTQVKGLNQLETIGKYSIHLNLYSLSVSYCLSESDKWNLLGGINDNQRQQLEEWIGLKCQTIIFDSLFDDWSISSSTFNNKIKEKRHLVFLIQDHQGEQFGYYLHTSIEKVGENQFHPTDSKSFHFNLGCPNERLHEMMKFEIKDTNYGGYFLYDNDNSALIQFGDICLNKENKKQYSTCEENVNNFDYHGIHKALCGIYGKFIPERVIVIQMI